MLKKIFIGTLIASAVIGQKMVGGFHEVDQSALTQLQNDQSFNRAEQKAREAFRSERNSELGQVVRVREQVVAGMNYQIIFETESGEQWAVVVFVQPWSDTYEVKKIKPVNIKQ